MTDGVKVNPSKATLVTTSGQLARLTVQGMSIVILARMLSPHDYGVVAGVLLVVGVGEVIRDGGFNVAVIQKRDLTRVQHSNLFWLSAAVGLVLSTTLAVIAESLATVFSEPAVASVAKALAPILLLNAVAAQWRADLARDLRATRLAISDVSSQALALTAGVIVALQGGGYWALVAQQLGLAIGSVMYLAAASRFRPTLPRRGVGTRPLIQLSSMFLATQLIVYGSQNVAQMVVGMRLGSNALGLLNRVTQLVGLPIGQITPAATNLALPLLNNSHHPERLLSRAAAALSYAPSLLIVPVVVAPEFFVGVLLGGGSWQAAAPLLGWLAGGALFQLLGMTNFWWFLRTARLDENLRFTLIARGLLIFAVAVASIGGLLAVVVAYSLGQAAIWLAGSWWLAHRLQVSSGAGVLVGVRAFAVAASAAILTMVAAAILESGAGATALIAVVVYLLTLAAASLIPAVRQDILGLARVFALGTVSEVSERD